MRRRFGPDRAECEGDLTGRVSGRQRAAIDQIVEQGHAGAKDDHRCKPRAQRGEGQTCLAQPPGRDHGNGSAAEDGDVGVADEGRELERREAGEARPAAPPRTRLGCEHCPQHGAGAGRDERGVGERRHVVAPGKGQRGTGGAVQTHRRQPAEAPEPAPSTDEQAKAGQQPVEQRRQADDAELLERRREERIPGVLLADPPPVAQLNPLVRRRGRVVVAASPPAFLPERSTGSGNVPRSSPQSTRGRRRHRAPRPEERRTEPLRTAPRTQQAQAPLPPIAGRCRVLRRIRPGRRDPAARAHQG